MVARPPIIIGVDPGGTTGFAVWNDSGVALEWFTQADAKTAVAHIWHLLEQNYQVRDIHVACERYDITPQTARMSRQYDALHVSGALRFKCELLDERTNTTIKYVPYGRSDAKRFADDARLKTVGWHVPGKDHTNDAIRQVMMHLGTVQPEVLKQLLLRR